MNHKHKQAGSFRGAEDEAGLSGFEQRLCRQLPARVPDTLEFRITGQLAEAEGGVPFGVQAAPAGPGVRGVGVGGGRSIGHMLAALGAVAAVLLAAMLLLWSSGEQVEAPVVVAAEDRAQTRESTAAAPAVSVTRRPVPRVGLDRELLGVEGLGLIRMDDGAAYEGYRLRIRDTGHWHGSSQRSVHVSRDGEGTLLVPVVYY